MRIGVLKEAQEGETRVAATPNTVAQLVTLGYEIVVEAGAGALSSFNDAAYATAGASIGDPFETQVVFGVNAPSREQLDRLAPHTTLISWLSPMFDEALVADLAKRPRSRSMPYPGSAGRSRWTCSARWPISPATERSSRRRTNSGVSSPVR
jgi:NAD(P) transhydrogenase subunit alpha